MVPGLRQSTTTVPLPLDVGHGRVESQVVPASYTPATGLPPGNTNTYLDDPEEDDEAHDAPLSLRVKLTGYRLLNILIIFTIGLAKFILSLNGQSVAPTGLEWAGGSVLTIVLYWIGLYEAVEPPMWEWFFHLDRAPAIIIFSKCFLGGVLLALFYLWKFLPIVPVYTIYVIAFFGIFSDPPLWSFMVITYVIVFLGVFLLQAVPTKWLVWHHIPVWAPVRRFFRRYGSPNSQARGSQYHWIGHAGFFCGVLLSFWSFVTMTAVMTTVFLITRAVSERRIWPPSVRESNII